MNFIENKKMWINLVDNKYKFDVCYSDFLKYISIIKNGRILYEFGYEKLNDIDEFKSIIIDRFDKINKTYETLNTIEKMVINRYKIERQYIKHDYDTSILSFSIYIHQKDEIIDFDIHLGEENSFNIDGEHNYHKIFFNGDYSYLKNLFNKEVADEIRRVRYGQV